MKKQQPKYEPDADYKVTITYQFKGSEIEQAIEKVKQNKKFLYYWINKQEKE